MHRVQTLTSFVVLALSASAAYTHSARQQACVVNTSPDKFQLRATYKSAPFASTNLALTYAEPTRPPRPPHIPADPNETSGYVLSVETPFHVQRLHHTLENNVLKAGNQRPIFTMSSTSFESGDSPLFIAKLFNPIPDPWAGYCFMNSDTPSGTPYLLAANDHADKWAVCSNSTSEAAPRLDVVYDPVANHASYELDSCKDISIEVVPIA